VSQNEFRALHTWLLAEFGADLVKRLLTRDFEKLVNALFKGSTTASLLFGDLGHFVLELAVGDTLRLGNLSFLVQLLIFKVGRAALASKHVSLIVAFFVIQNVPLDHFLDGCLHDKLGDHNTGSVQAHAQLVHGHALFRFGIFESETNALGDCHASPTFTFLLDNFLVLCHLL